MAPKMAAKVAAPKAAKAPAKPAAPKAAAPKAATAAAKAPGPALAPAPVLEGPLSVSEAGKLLQALPALDLQSLADSVDVEEQLPCRLVLEYVGDKDLSWTNAQASLRKAPELVQEMLEMEGGKFLTKKALERMEALGALDPRGLKEKSPAARVLALYLDASVRDARERLGLNVPPPALPPPAPDEPPPPWPIKVDFKELHRHLADAVRWRRTALVVGSGHAQEVDTFLNYSAYVCVDAKWVLGKTSIEKSISTDAMQEELRKRVVTAMKNGLPLCVAMSNSAVAFKEKFCSPGSFPQALFDAVLWNDETQPEADREYKKVIRESDLADWAGAFPGRIKEGFNIVVSTDFDLASAREFLPAALPHFDSMAVIEVDPASFA